MALNCGAIPENLLESELFGYSRGAFTGAFRDKPGLIEAAAGGTLFLDEIGDLSLHLQAKLLRLLQEREIRRIGENRNRLVDVRFISATNKNIEAEITQGNFREDLYYRLNVITIELDPLRKKREDIGLLLEYFIEKYSRQMGCDKVKISPKAMERLVSYSWPGNVRELQNEIQRCLILSGPERLIKTEDLSPRISPREREFDVPANTDPYSDADANTDTYSHNFFQAKADFEKRFLYLALSRCNYNRSQTARAIGLSRQGLFKLIKKHGIDLPPMTSSLRE